MNKMKLSALALGLVAAGAFAQAPAAAPAAAPAQEPAPAEAPAAPAPAQPAAAAPAAEAAAPAVQADSAKAAEEQAAAEAKKAEEEKAAAEAKKAEEERAAAEAKKAEEEKAAAEAKKAEEEKAAAEAKKAEEEKAAAEAKKAEEEKAAQAPTENTDIGEVANAAGSAFDMLKASMSEGTSEAKMEVKFSGEVEFDMYTNDLFADGDVEHSYETTFDLNVDVQFNDKWSAFVSLEADDETESPSAIYNGAFIQYKPADFFGVKFGDLTFSEGAFESYYNYDDPGDYAAGMKEHDIRGIEIDLAGLQLGFGFGRGDNDYNDDVDNFETSGDVYNLHVAYEFDYAGQHLRPFFDYKSYQEADHNELHAGVDAGLTLGGFSFRAVYGFHADYLTSDDDVDLTSNAHTILAEPAFEIAMFQIKTTFFYAFLSNNDLEGNEIANDIPEYFFAYAEPALKFAEFIKLGIPVEFHTNSLDDDADISTLDVGGRFYIMPVENLEIVAFGMIDIPVGDNNDDEDVGLKMGIETVFSF